jgi:sodium-dependent dicarboxylate transporter 2/3/5
LKRNTILFVVCLAAGLLLTLFVQEPLVFTLGNPRFNAEPQNIARYVNTFSSSVIWLMLGGFFLTTAMTKTKLDSDLFQLTLRLSGTTPRRLLLGLMLTTMIASNLMSNTATTAMVIAAVMPMIASLGRESSFSKALLVGIPLAASTGGMGTIIGTPPNLVAAGALENAGLQVDFLSWMQYGVPLAVFLTLLGYLVLVRIFLKDDKPLDLGFLQKEEGSPGVTRGQKAIVIVIVLATLTLSMTSSLHNLSVAAVGRYRIRNCWTTTRRRSWRWTWIRLRSWRPSDT